MRTCLVCGGLHRYGDTKECDRERILRAVMAVPGCRDNAMIWTKGGGEFWFASVLIGSEWRCVFLGRSVDHALATVRVLGRRILDLAPRYEQTVLVPVTEGDTKETVERNLAEQLAARYAPQDEDACVEPTSVE